MSKIRENYYRDNSIDEKTEIWIDKLKETSGRRPLRYFGKTALMIIDPQKLFCHESSPAFLPSWTEVEKKCISLVNAFKANEIPVIITRHVMDKSKSYPVFEAHFNKKLEEDDPFSELISPFNEESNIICKDNFSVFSSENIDEYLGSIDTLIIAGAQSNLCVLSTCMDCSNFGIIPIVIADGVCARNEELQFATLNLISSGHGFIMSSDEIIERLGA